MTKTTRRTLDNGLTVILKEAHSAPVISWWLAYKVGGYVASLHADARILARKLRG